MFETGGSEARDEVAARAHALVDAVLGCDPGTAPGSELTAAIEARAALASIIDGAVVGIVPQWEASTDWAVDGARSPVVALVNRTGAHKTAAGALRKTGLLAASMPHVSAAVAAGVLPLSHLHLLTRARKPEVAVVFDRDEADLVAEAKTRTADSLSGWLTGWYFGALAELGINEPDRDPGSRSEADTARIITGFAGRGIVTVDLTPESLAIWVSAVEGRIERWRRAGQLTEDTRTYPELVGAALTDCLADGANTTRSGQTRPLLIVTAKLADLFDRAGVPPEERERWSARISGGGPIGHAALRELMEKADIQFLVTDDDGEPLHLGRKQRLVTAALLRALLTRSGGTCEFPGCHATHHRAHAHHITWWRNGGETDIRNLALLCPHHHRLVHHGWTLTRGPTGLVFRRPDGTTIDPPPFAQAA